MEINEIFKLADLFYKMSELEGYTQEQQTIDAIRNAIKNKYGDPPMGWINSLSDEAYKPGSKCNLVIYLKNSKPVAEFIKAPGSVDNMQILKELNARFSKEIVASFGKQINDVIELEKTKRSEVPWDESLFKIIITSYPEIPFPTRFG